MCVRRSQDDGTRIADDPHAIRARGRPDTLFGFPVQRSCVILERTERGEDMMKAIVVKDQTAGMAGMTLVERPEPKAAINDVIVQVHASGFVPTELTWPSTWTN